MKPTLPTFLSALGSKITTFKNLCCLLVVLLLSGGAWGQTTQTFSYTGANQTFTVPAGVTSITITATGAAGGGTGNVTGKGGMGAAITGTFTVTPGHVFNILVGGLGTTAGAYGGGGGGGTFVSNSTTSTLLIAGGGGGGGSYNATSGKVASVTTTPTSTAGSTGGTGTLGGTASTTASEGGGGSGYTGNGASNLGGGGGIAPPTATGGAGSGSGTAGGFGGGGGGGANGGGGGGGYAGGGGGKSGSGGGGGSSYNGGTSPVTSATNTGNGSVTITYTLTNTWTGTTSTDWNTATNWSLGTVPTSGNSVVIASAANQPIIGAAASCGSLTLNSSSTLVINNTLAVGANWTNNSATTAVSGSGTVTFSGTTTIGGTFATTFPNLTISGGTTTNTITGTSVAGTCSVTAGTFVMSTSTSTVFNLYFKNISLTGTGVVSTSTGTLTGISTIIDITGNYSQGSGTTWSTPGSGVGQMNFTGGGNTTYSNSGTISWHGIKITNNTTLTLLSNLSFAGWLTSGTNLILESGSFLSAGTYTITNTATGFTWAISGTLKTANSNGLSGSTTTTLVSTNTPTITLGAASTIEYNAAGPQTVTARSDYANVTLSGSGIKTFTATPTIAGKLSMQGTATTASATPTYGASATLEYKGSAAQTTGVEFPATFSGSGGVIINNANGVTLGASKAISSGLTLTSGAFASGAYTLTYSGTGSSINRTSGTLDISNANGGLTFTNATTALTLPASLFTGNINNLTLNGTGGVTLNNSITLSGILTLTSGKLTTTSANLLTIINTATSAVSGGSSSSYVNGPIVLTLPASLASGSTYVFPIGKGTYNPFSLVNPTTSSGGTVTVNSEVFDSNAGGSAGTGLGSLNTNRYWAASITSGSVNFTNTLIKLEDSSVASISAVTSSTTLTGAYDIVGGTSPTVVVSTSVTSVTPESTTLPGYFAIGSFPLPMSYSSSTTTQNVTSITQTNTSNQQIIGMQVVTSGNTSPLDATSFTINTTGTTSASTDITNAKIWYTGTNATFATTTQFGSAVASPIGSYDITGTQTLSEGTNYFWLTYDIPTTAITNNLVDAQFTSVTVGGTSQTPTTTSPTGTRTIKGVLNGVYNIGASQVAPNYTLLTNAIADIGNYGVSGAVTFQLMSDYSSTTEIFPLTINAYTGANATNTLTIKPASGVTATISGSSASSIFKLNGADYVTIDGSNSGGTDKSLSISNSNTGTTSAVIWVASASASDGAANNTIKNCVITGNSSTTTYSCISLVGTASVGSAALTSNSNNTIKNNKISKSQYGIILSGTSSTTLDANNQILNNNLGSSISGDGFSICGIYSAFQNSETISGNDIQNIFSITGASTTNILGIFNTDTTSSTISSNKIHNLVYQGTSTAKIYGLYSGTTNFITSSNPSNLLHVNNVIYDFTSSCTSATWALSGINNGGGYGDKYYFNTVNLKTTLGATYPAAAFANGQASITTFCSNIDVRNNIFVMKCSSTSTSATLFAYYTTATSLSGSTLNNNDLVSASPGTGSAVYYTAKYNSTNYSTLADWKTGSVQETNSISSDPLFISATDLRPGLGSPVAAAGIAGTGIITDYLGTSRGTPPTIGAFETLVDAVGPIITYTTLGNTYITTNRTTSSFAAITDASGVNTTVGTLPRLYYKKSTSANAFVGNTSADNGWKYVEANGSSSPFDFTIDYSKLLTSAVSSGDIIQYFVVAQDLAATPNISINSGTFAATPVSVDLTSGAFPITGTINQFLITASMSGNITVPGNYPSLTLTGGAFEAINNATVTGNITIQIAGDLAAEIGTNALNAFASPYTVTIQPAGGALRTISGSAAGAVIKLNGADRVTIDGLNTGGNALTISNLSTAATTAVIWNASLGAGAGATNNTIKNCTLSNGSSAVLNFGISVSGASIGSNGADNDDLTIQGNTISSCATGIYAIGTATVSSGGLDNLNINNNNVTTNTSSVTSVGIQLGNALNASISQNTLDIQQSASNAPVGISLETGFNTSTVTKNKIVRSFYTGTGGYGGRGITIGTASATSAITISNNIIYGVNGDNWTAFGNSSSMGIAIGTIGGSSTITTVAGGINLYNNSVNMYGSYSKTSACLTAALYIGSGASALDIKNNIFVNSLNNSTTATSKAYAIYSAAANTAFTTINYNDYYVSGSQGVLGFLTSDRTNLAGIVTGFGQNANSYNADSGFTSTTNLLPVANIFPSNYKLGTNISGITTDYSGTTRSNPPDIGAYEGTDAYRWIGATNTTWATNSNWDNGTAASSNQSVTIAANNLNNPVLGADVIVNGLDINDSTSTLTLGSNTLTINGAVTGTGTLTGSSTSNLTIAGTAGTLNFTNGSRALNNLSLGASGVATLGSALDIYGTVGFTTGGSLNLNAKAVTLKSTASATARVSDLTGSTLTGATNVTVERFILGKRAWRALTAPVIGSTNNSIFYNWQNNGTVTAGVGVELWSSIGGNGMGTGPSNSILKYNNSGTTGAWDAITNTNSNYLFDANINNAFMVYVTGPYASTSTNITSGFADTTLKATGQLITGPKSYLNVPSGVHTLIGNPYASPLSPSSLLNDNSTNFGNNLWVWDASAAGTYSAGAYNIYEKLANTYTNITNSAPFGTSPDIQSGQAFFVKASSGTATFTISESNKGSAISNSFLRTAAPELFRVGLYKQENNQWSGRDGAMTVIFSEANANQDPNKMANGTENIAFTKNGALYASNYHLPLVSSDVLNIRVWKTTAGANYKLKINTEQFTTTNLDATLEDLFTNSRTPLALDGSAVEYPFTVTTDALSSGDRFRIVFQTSALGINNPKANGFSIVPNPVTGDSFQVNLGTLATGTYTYSICNALGQEVEKGSIENAVQNTNYSVKFRESAATGIYIMKIKGNNNSVFTAKIIKK